MKQSMPAVTAITEAGNRIVPLTGPRVPGKRPFDKALVKPL
jgi:hypothetical protein